MRHASGLLRTTSAIAAGAALLTSLHTSASAQQQQQTGDSAREMEEIVVTGSYIRRDTQAAVGTPLEVLDRGDIDQIGASNIADIIQTLTINTGSQNNPDAFTQNLTTGTSNFNLRGLGVSSTLVLLNGRRQVVSGAPTDDGLTFVDTASLVPQIAIQRLEVVKDGAAALYGSDAVGGVANFITRNNFEGLELDAEFKAVTDEGASESVRVGGIAGGGFDDGRGHAVVAVEYFDQTQLTTDERRLSPLFGPDVSAIGQPGTFAPLIDANNPQQVGTLVNSPGGPAFLQAQAAGSDFVPGPSCPREPAPNGPFPRSLVGQTSTGQLVCELDFGDAFTLAPRQTRLQGFARTHYELSEAAEFYGEFTFARNRTERNNSPTFPVLDTFFLGGQTGEAGPQLPPNPFNPFNVDVLGIFRPLGTGDFPRSDHDSDTWRVSAGLRGDFADNWRYDVNFVRAINDFDVNVRDTLEDRFFAALNGLGGPDCPVGTPLSGRGQGGCQFFNPFGSALTAPEGATATDPVTGQPVPLRNSQSVIQDFLAFAQLDFRSRLWTANALVSGDTGGLFELPGGPIGIAVGGQFRHQGFGLDAGDNLNRGNFLFISGAGTSIQDFFDSRDTWAGFIETSFPFTDWFELTAAGRFEDTQAIESTLDPKVSAIVRPMDGLRLRASFSTSFRAPSIFQQSSTGTVTLEQVNDPLLGNTSFIGTFTKGNPNLEPEESDQFNVGFTYEPEPGFQIKLDFWHFDFSDVIVQENAQALLNQAAADGDIDGDGQLEDPSALLNPNRFVRGDQPVPLLLQANTDFVNAPSIETNGIDFGMNWRYQTRFGTISPSFQGTLITEYEVADPSIGRVIDGKGSRNFRNIGAPTPPLRFNANLNWSWGPHSLFGSVRFVDSFEDDQNCVNSDIGVQRNRPDAFVPTDPTDLSCPEGFEIAKVDSQITLDLQYSLAVHELLDLPGNEEITLTAGADNITDETPPFVNTNSGFATRVHDPRGRLAYLRMTVGF